MSPVDVSRTSAPLRDRLDGKCIVVMGAGSIAPGWSNGKACAVQYAREGASVVCVDRRTEAALETADLINDEGGRAIALGADATVEADVRAVVERAVAEFGRLDVMHNNVGVGGVVGAPDNIDVEDWDREVRQNLTTAYLGIRCAVPAMRALGGGVIINTSSTLAVRFLAHPNVAYSASKAAVEAMTRACSLAYGADNIRVNCIRIGFSETAFLQHSLDVRGLSDVQQAEAMARSRGKVPLRGEHGDPFDVARAATFLASDEAGYITGVVLDVDGGIAHRAL